MARMEQTHWHEGLFLRPHHLQSMQRNIFNQFAHERRLGWAYPYGLIESRLSQDELENMRIRFDRLRVIMPSGVEVNVPDNADLPALDISEIFEASGGPFTVSLGVPLWYANRANAVEVSRRDEGRIKRIYKVSELELPDENTGDNAQAVLVRRVNGWLLLPEDDPTDMEVLPLMRICHAAGEEVGLPRQDPAFVPPCLLLSASAVLRDPVRDLANAVEATRKDLVGQFTRAGFSIETMRGAQFEQMLRLRTLNRFSGRLTHLVAAPGVTCFQIYLELRQLLGELAALYPTRDPFDVPDYDHDEPAICFKELCAKIRSLLAGAVVPTFLRVTFETDPQRKVLVADLTEEHLTLPVEYFLAIRCQEDPRALTKLVEDLNKFKLMPKALWNQRIFGIRLGEERTPPVGLPATAGVTYYRLLRSESARMWDRIKDEKALAVRWPGVESTDWQLTLYMMLPQTEGNA